MTRAGFSYARTRLHARLAARMSEPDWQQLENSLDFAHALELAGRMPVARWTRRLTRASGVHVVEDVLRQELRADIDDVAAWLPQRWRDAATWFGLLPFLREKEFAASDEELPDWFDATAPEGEDWADAAARWRSEWDQRLARTGRNGRLNAVLAPILTRFLGEEGAALRAWTGLDRYFVKAFRGAVQGPEAVFAYLSLSALDSERLRGILVGHSIFTGGR